MKELTQDFVDSKLREIGDRLLNKIWRKQWSTEKPTTGYCYIVTEAIYHYHTNEGYIPTCLALPNGKGTHWFLKNKVTGHIIDFTATQFNEPVDYSVGKGCGFMKGSVKTSKGYISRRAYEIAKILGLVLDEGGVIDEIST